MLLTNYFVCMCHLLSLPPGGPGLHDPCEKEPTNTLANMTDQQAEAITYSAQVHTHTASSRHCCYPPAVFALSCQCVRISKQHACYQTERPHHHPNHTTRINTHTHLCERACVSPERALWCCILMIGVGNYCHRKP